MRASHLAALGAAAWCAPAAAAHVPAVAALLDVPRRVDSDAGVALTFDDGPHPEGTPAVLSALERARAHATFFLVGEQVVRLPSLVAEIAAAGHGVGVHGFRHALLLRRRPSDLRDDFARAEDAIAEAAGVRPRLYRPPYGVFSYPALRLVRRRGWSPLLWSRWGRDWEAGATATTIARRATDGLEPGDVVLLHDADHYSSPDSWRRTAAALPSVLEAVAESGASFAVPSQAR